MSTTVSAFKPEADAKPVRVGEFLVDLQAQSVFNQSTRLDLPDLSLRLLLSLVRHAPDRVGKEQLVSEVWEGIAVSDETLAQRVRLLRQSLGDDGRQPRYIATVRNQGYRLIAPVSEMDDEPEQTPSKIKAPGDFQINPGAFRFWPVFLGLGVLVVAVTGFFFLRGADNAGTNPPIAASPTPAIAVLPFTHLSPDPGGEYFTVGFHEELISRLSGIEDFVVVPRRSVLPFQDTELDATALAQALDVDIIVEGSVRLRDREVRVSAQLIDGVNNRNLWSQTFERRLTMQNLFAIQSELATAIAGSLQVELSPPQITSLVSLPTQNLDAYNLYLLGRFHTFQPTPSNLERAIGFLNRAVTMDPEFAQAWSILGLAYSFQGTTYGSKPPAEVFPRAREAVLRALALDSDLANAHSLYGEILTWYDWDWETAEREYRTTLDLDPFNGLGYALFLGTQLRHQEALALIERLLERFPQDSWIRINAAWRYLRAGHYQRAISEAQLAASHTDALEVQGWAQLYLGNHPAALELFARDAVAKPNSHRAASNLAIASIRNGNPAQGRSILTQLLTISESNYVAPELIAKIYFELGDRDAGFQWLERAFQARSRGLIFLQEVRFYDQVRNDPRFQQLLAKMAFL